MEIGATHELALQLTEEPLFLDRTIFDASGVELSNSRSLSREHSFDPVEELFSVHDLVLLFESFRNAC
jgi:hypothetical protein